MKETTAHQHLGVLSCCSYVWTGASVRRRIPVVPFKVEIPPGRNPQDSEVCVLSGCSDVNFNSLNAVMFKTPELHCSSHVGAKDATRNKCIASSNKCLTSSNKKLLGAPGLTRSDRTLLGTNDPRHFPLKIVVTVSSARPGYYPHVTPAPRLPLPQARLLAALLRQLKRWKPHQSSFKRSEGWPYPCLMSFLIHVVDLLTVSVFPRKVTICELGALELKTSVDCGHKHAHTCLWDWVRTQAAVSSHRQSNIYIINIL